MGIFFITFFQFSLVPLLLALFMIWLFVDHKYAKRLFGIGAAIAFGVLLFSIVRSYKSAKVLLKKEDYYGEYIIDRDFYPGKQADWQYDHFRFQIKPNDSILFYLTEKESTLRVYNGTISTVKPFQSERLVTHFDQPTHHILNSTPTVYRSNRDFTLVFRSPRFYNVRFKKGRWKQLGN
jgi:hypothetical protein